jgi:hypothetical protein
MTPVGEIPSKPEWIMASPTDGTPIFTNQGSTEIMAALATVRDFDFRHFRMHKIDNQGQDTNEIDKITTLLRKAEGQIIFDIYPMMIDGDPRLVFYKNVYRWETVVPPDELKYVQALSNAILAKLPATNGIMSMPFHLENVRGTRGKRTRFNRLPNNLVGEVFKATGPKRLPNPLLSLTGGRKKKTRRSKTRKH